MNRLSNDDRTAQSAYRFMRNLAPRLAYRVQLSTDGHHAYLVAVKAAFLASPIDYGMLVKIYGDSAAGYSPAECIGARHFSPPFGLAPGPGMHPAEIVLPVHLPEASLHSATADTFAAVSGFRTGKILPTK